MCPRRVPRCAAALEQCRLRLPLDRRREPPQTQLAGCHADATCVVKDRIGPVCAGLRAALRALGVGMLPLTLGTPTRSATNPACRVPHPASFDRAPREESTEHGVEARGGGRNSRPPEGRRVPLHLSSAGAMVRSLGHDRASPFEPRPSTRSPANRRSLRHPLRGFRSSSIVHPGFRCAPPGATFRHPLRGFLASSCRLCPDHRREAQQIDEAEEARAYLDCVEGCPWHPAPVTWPNANIPSAPTRPRDLRPARPQPLGRGGLQHGRG
jgi:hypothetical protein